MQAHRISLLLAVGMVGVSATAHGTVIDNLGTLGGTQSRGYAINEAGQIAGYARTPGDVSTHAFRYTGTPGAGGVMHDLGTLGGTSSFGFAINASGQVAGQSQTTLVNPNVEHAFRYTGTPGAGGVMQDLGTLGGASSYGYAINASGQVAGFANTPGNVSTRAFRYTGTPGAGGVMQNLGTLGGTDSYGLAINDSGQVAGYANTPGNAAQHAFRYTGTPGAGGVMLDLGTLGGTFSGGTAINASGQVAGFANTPGNVSTRAFLYTGTPGVDGVMHDLGTLGGTESYGTAINDAGQVAGWANRSGDFTRYAFLYTGTPGVDGLMIDLDLWLDTNYPALGAFWTLREAFGINNTGLITGYGTYNDGPGGLEDGQRAFRLDASSLIPEPASLSLLSLASLTLLRRRRHN